VRAKHAGLIFYLGYGPGGVIGNERFGVLQGLLQSGQSGGAAPVAKGHGHVAEQAAAFGAGHGRAIKTGAERGFIQNQQVNQFGNGPIGVKFQKRGVGRVGVTPHPRTNFLAGIAAKNPVAQQRAQVNRNIALVLNGEVRNTTVAIQNVGGRKGVGGANSQAAGALAAGAGFC
jgi:hypothetical protein